MCLAALACIAEFSVVRCILCLNVIYRVVIYPGDGYCRSEAIVAIYLQKKESAKRIYATLVHSKTNSDGYKDQGILLPCNSVTAVFIRLSVSLMLVLCNKYTW